MSNTKPSKIYSVIRRTTGSPIVALSENYRPDPDSIAEGMRIEAYSYSKALKKNGVLVFTVLVGDDEESTDADVLLVPVHEVESIRVTSPSGEEPDSLLEGEQYLFGFHEVL